MCTNDLIFLHPLGIFILCFLFFSEKNLVCRDRTHVPTCQKVTWLPLSYRGNLLYNSINHHARISHKHRMYRWYKRIWAPNPFVVLLRNVQTDLDIRVWTILVPIRLKKNDKNEFGPFSYKFSVPIRVGLENRFEFPPDVKLQR